MGFVKQLGLIHFYQGLIPQYVSQMVHCWSTNLWTLGMN